MYWITSTDNFYLIGKHFVGKKWKIFRQVIKIFANESRMFKKTITNNKRLLKQNFFHF